MYELWKLPGQGGWHQLNEVSGSSLPVSVSGRITSFLLFICMQGWPHFTVQHNVAKDKAENWLFLILFCSCDDSSKPLPSTSSELVDNRPPTQEGNQTSQESANASQNLNRHQWEMLTAMEGPKLKDTESRAVICRACTEFCNRCKSQNFK